MLFSAFEYLNNYLGYWGTTLLATVVYFGIVKVFFHFFLSLFGR